MNRLLATLFLLLASTAAADTLLVVNKGDATLAFVDAATMTVAGKAATGKEPHEVAVSEDGKTAVVTNYGGETPGTTLTVVDVNAKKVLRTVALPGLSGPHGIQAMGNRFYITAEGSRAVARYDAAADRIDWIGGTGQEITHMVAVTRDGKKLYTTNIGSGSVSVLDLTNGRLKQIAVESRGPEGLDLTPDGSALWVAGVSARGVEARITVIDVKTDTVVRTIPNATVMANRLKFTPDGKHVAVSDPGKYEVAIFDAASGAIVKKITTAAEPAGLVFAPDGKRLFVACAVDGKVQAIDTATWTVVAEVETGKAPDGLAYVKK